MKQEKKTFWIINQYACTPNDGNPGRSYYIGLNLAQQGNTVKLLAARNTHVQRFKRNKNLSENISENFSIFWLQSLSYSQSKSVVRVINWFLFLIQLIFVKPDAQKPDVILYSSPSPIGYLGAYILSKRHKTLLVFEVRDIWPCTLIQIGRYPKHHPLFTLMFALERFACKKSNLVISNLPGYEKYLIDNEIAYQKFAWISNGVSHPSNPNETTPLPMNRYFDKSKFIVGYMGSIGIANRLDVLIETAILLREKTNVFFAIFGDGQLRTELERLVKNHNLYNVEFFGPVKKEDTIQLIQQFDLSYIGWSNLKLYDYGTAPNKIFDYMAAGTPILQTYSGHYDLVTRFGCGWTIPAENPKYLSKKIIEIAYLSREELSKRGKNGTRAAIEHFQYEKLTNQLLHELEQI